MPSAHTYLLLDEPVFERGHDAYGWCALIRVLSCLVSAPPLTLLGCSVLEVATMHSTQHQRKIALFDCSSVMKPPTSQCTRRIWTNSTYPKYCETATKLHVLTGAPLVTALMAHTVTQTHKHTHTHTRGRGPPTTAGIHPHIQVKSIKV